MVSTMTRAPRADSTRTAALQLSPGLAVEGDLVTTDAPIDRVVRTERQDDHVGVERRDVTSPARADPPLTGVAGQAAARHGGVEERESVRPREALHAG
jgi:hypothetical protein